MQITLNNKIFNITPEKYSIESIIVFGSFIRGDNTDHSDIDFLIIVDNCTYQEKILKKLYIAEEMKIPFSWISIYTTDEIYDLCLYGDNFLWSIKLEGIILYSRSGFFEYCLCNLKIYTNMINDIIGNYKKVNTINNNFINRIDTNSSILKKIGYIIRNTLTILAYTSGVISFNKHDVFDICQNIPDFSLPFSKENYINLLDIKAAIKDNTLDINDIPECDKYIKFWIKKTYELLNLSYNKILELTSEGFTSPLTIYI